jgi:hypothetical protein
MFLDEGDRLIQWLQITVAAMHFIDFQRGNNHAKSNGYFNHP